MNAVQNTQDEVRIIVDNLRQSLRALEERTGSFTLLTQDGVLAVRTDTGTGTRWHRLYEKETT